MTPVLALSLLGLKSCVIALVALAVLKGARNQSAARRSLIARTGIASLLVLLVSTLMTLARPEAAREWTVSVASGVQISELTGDTEPARATAIPADQSPGPAGISTASLLMAAYLIPAIGGVGALLFALLELRKMRVRAVPAQCPQWRRAVAAACRRQGLARHPQLLVSDAIDAPLCYGLIRPVVLLDRETLRKSADADAVVAHEIAHLARMDWPALIVERLVTAVFWYNPLVWMLVRHSRELAEHAADDLALRGGVERAHYAEVLLGLARSSLAAAAGRVSCPMALQSSLARRIRDVLDAKRPRESVRAGFAAMCVATALAVSGTVSALTLGGDDAPVAASAGAGERAAAKLASLKAPQALALAEAIRAKDWARRRASGQKSGELFQIPGAVPPLVEALGDPDPVVRRIALWGLSEMRYPQTADDIAPLLGDADPVVRGEAARALGDIGQTEHIRAIQQLLADKEPTVRAQAAHALADLGDRSSIPALELALAHATREDQPTLVWALRELKGEP